MSRIASWHLLTEPYVGLVPGPIGAFPIHFGPACENKGAGGMEARLPVSSFQIGQQILHGLRLGRLDEMMIEPRLCRSPPILWLAPAGQRRQDDLFKSRRL